MSPQASTATAGYWRSGQDAGAAVFFWPLWRYSALARESVWAVAPGVVTNCPWKVCWIFTLAEKSLGAGTPDSRGCWVCAMVLKATSDLLLRWLSWERLFCACLGCKPPPVAVEPNASTQPNAEPAEAQNLTICAHCVLACCRECANYVAPTRSAEKFKALWPSSCRF